ncbi:MAG: glucose-6-phosphate isomerase [Bacteroidetes bacterium GWF2_38_335]|nr:MAG: glucose-6-phosphate isomerase [Bacteroidetes bacterium GWF2_38_335]OFY77951.1 MAG: glucose-6-phosphate isomerase [Bacteroidetes bacterium RIFOXYA12_FULL_38_20]HBS86692.1 glucose-6-phosphate isomerase [Bacteroidales bacterium]
MRNISINLNGLSNFIPASSINQYKFETKNLVASLLSKKGKGNDFLGWITLPNEISPALLADLNQTAEKLRKQSDYVVVIGIGGSYLGARAAIEALSHSFEFLREDSKTKVLFAGQNICEDYHYELLEILKNKSFSIIVISKSGTTTEPAIAFRLLKNLLEEKYSKDEVKNRIVAITDKKKGALKLVADKEGYKTYEIPDDVGGRYSILTPVGLLPIACAGFDIEKMVEGAKVIAADCNENIPFEKSITEMYATVRNILYGKGKKVEMLVNFHPKLTQFTEWWKQLYGESEGKENKGIFPAGANFTSDLHSMGQYIQEGERILFETILSVGDVKHTLKVPAFAEDVDGLNYLAGRRMDEVNKMAELGTMIAHIDGGVPNIIIEVPEINEYYLGQLIFFFEFACAISGYIINVNPFDQPGVEAYKNNMFALLEKPGHEEQTKKIKMKLKK